MVSLGDRVEPPGVPGVAAGDPPRGEPAALHGAVPLQRGDGVRGAGGVEAAGRREQRGDEPLVGPDDADERQGGGARALHRAPSRASRSRATASASRAPAIPTSPAPARAITTRSTAGRSGPTARKA